MLTDTAPSRGRLPAATTTDDDDWSTADPSGCCCARAVFRVTSTPPKQFLLEGLPALCVRLPRVTAPTDLERPTSYRTCTLRRSPRGRIAPLTSRAGRRRRPRCVRRHSPHHRWPKKAARGPHPGTGGGLARVSARALSRLPCLTVAPPTHRWMSPGSATVRRRAACGTWPSSPRRR